MKNNKGIKELFMGVVDSANEIEKEIKRLVEIEERVAEVLETTEKEIVGFEKALGYSSISYDARSLMQSTLDSKQKKVNRVCRLLGIAKKYDTK